jgi:hypothetical protein
VAPPTTTAAQPTFDPPDTPDLPEPPVTTVVPEVG